MPIVTTIEGRIAQVAIDRPEKRNTLSSELCKDLAREFLELNDDTRVRSIVLCGHNNVFCAGLDIEEQLAENTPIFNEFQKVIDALDALYKPGCRSRERSRCQSGRRNALSLRSRLCR